MKSAIYMIAAAAAVWTTAATAQIKPVRDWPQLKAETQRRADIGGSYPVFGITPSDAKEALDRITSLDPDAWGASWMQEGDKYSNRAKSEETGDRQAAIKDYVSAWRLYSLGSWPMASSPKKQESFLKARAAFEAYGNLLDPKIEAVSIPFEGKQILAFLEKPKGVSKPPIVLSIAGTDLFRDYTANVTRSFLPAGIASMTVDMPGTGDSPLPARPGSERIFSKMIDYIKTRPDLDGDHIIIRGESWGSYWAARVAYAEPTRILGTVFQSGPVDGYFQPDWQKTAFSTKEFLFDYAASRLHMLGVDTVEQAYEFMPTLSLRTDGLVDKPSAPMLVIGGARDTQVPFSDTTLLLTHGSPKYAWINPTGMTMGRSDTIKDQWIFDNVIVPWVKDRVQASSAH